MTKEEILKKAIEKAVKNGFKRGELVLEMMNNKKYSYSVNAQSVIIFDHNFAKAFFGDAKTFLTVPVKFCFICIKRFNKYLSETGHLPHWQYHLQQLVIEPEPLKYLEKFL